MVEESKKLGDHFSSENPIFLIYKNILGLYDPEKNEQAYQDGKKLLNQYFQKISKQDQIAILLNLRNYVIRKINIGLTNFYDDLLELYKLGLQLDIIVDNKKISEGDFTNIVLAGCVVKEFEWTKQFIETYKNRLDEIIRNDAIALSKASLHFHMKEYSETIDLLNNHQFQQIFHQLKGRTLLIRTWFEQFLLNDDYYELLIAQLEAFEKLIRRNDIVASHKKEGYLNFILATKHLSDFISQNKPPGEIKMKMKKYLEESRKIILKKWIEEKVDSL